MVRISLLLGILLCSSCQVSEAACSSTGLAAVDLAGNCRATPNATMGALEAIVANEPIPLPEPPPTTIPPGTVKVVTIPASDVLEVSSTGVVRRVTAADTYGYCIGRQKDTLCRAAYVFPTAGIPRGTEITKVQLKVSLVYTSAPSPYTWAISRYGSIGDLPTADTPLVALVRVDGERYINATTAYRTVGNKTTLINTAITDLTIATLASKPFAIGIKLNQENEPDKFAAMGHTDAQKAKLVVTVKYQ